jgi:general secretion pathway protein K
MELRAVSGMNEESYQALRPYICARPRTETAKININGLTEMQAPVLASLLGQGQMELAMQLILERPPLGYASTVELKASSPLGGVETKNIDFDALIYAPEYIWVEAEILYQGARRSMIMEYAISGGKAVQIYRSFSPEARRPVAQAMSINGAPI